MNTENTIKNTTVSVGISEPDLIRKSSNGDKSSFKILYENHSGKIYSFANRISADIDLAKDLTQRTFIKAWENIGDFQSNSSFYTWLQKITLNEYLMEVRSSSRADLRQEIFADGQPKVVKPEFEEKMDLENSISSLPENQRIVFCLFHVEGYSINEISLLLDIAEGTVKSQLHAARKKLIKELQND